MAAEVLQAPTATNSWVKVFQIAMWIGILQNLILALPAIFVPAMVLKAVGQAVPDDLTWVSASALVLVFLAGMYVPAAWNPLHYPWTTWLSILARVPGVLFFWYWHPNIYPLFGWIDLVMVAVQLPLWFLALATPKRNMATQAK